jgi:hypothetical protein
MASAAVVVGLAVGGCGQLDGGYDKGLSTRSAAETATPTPFATARRALGRGADQGALRAARRFLRGYLLYAYGRGSALAVDAATGALRGRLLREPPRVPEAVRQRRARVANLTTVEGGFERARLVADVDDDRTRYSIVLVMTRVRGRTWAVAEVR